jgi:ribosome biogenesis GTPase / thiamine phosphate phosphatase
VLLGPAGAGKSTLVNRLAGRDLLATGEARGHGTGARTAAAVRQLFALAGGALLIDTPGLRALGSGWAEAGTAAFDVPRAVAERRR